MLRKDIKITSGNGGQFDCYLVTPDGDSRTPVIVLAAAVHGVDEDIRGIADEFGASGYICAAPDLFWRTVPGPLGRDDNRTRERSQPRLQKIKEGEADLIDTLAAVRKLPQFNGRSAVMGFCYGGPYAILGPKRCGYDAGISVHGSQMGDYVKDLEGVAKTVLIIWGDDDHQAPPPVLDAYRAAAARVKNLELHIFPGIKHGFMAKSNAAAYDQKTYDFSMQRTRAILDGLKSEELRKAS